MEHIRQVREFDEIWDSMEPFIKDRLKKVDENLRTIYREAQICGVRKDLVQQKLNERFWNLWRKIIEEATS